MIHPVATGPRDAGSLAESPEGALDVGVACIGSAPGAAAHTRRRGALGHQRRHGDGVTLTLAAPGALKVRWPRTVLDRWLPFLEDRKDEILARLAIPGRLPR